MGRCSHASDQMDQRGKVPSGEEPRQVRLRHHPLAHLVLELAHNRGRLLSHLRLGRSRGSVPLEYLQAERTLLMHCALIVHRVCVSSSGVVNAG